jgi:peptidoglycan/LPS O-acetylase OafA/YrhL
VKGHDAGMSWSLFASMVVSAFWWLLAGLVALAGIMAAVLILCWLALLVFRVVINVGMNDRR